MKMKNNLVIRVKRMFVKNFKLYKEETFNFDDNMFILISGANGFGKSTVLDAIEWCLTGDIRRITNSFLKRNTSKSEQKRVDNNRGIIKNKFSGKNDEVLVILTLSVNGKEIRVRRSQVNDSLNSENELFFEGDVSEKLKTQIVKAINSEYFYSYNICDTYKNYDFLTSSRSNILNMFRDFIKDRPDIDKVLLNLDNTCILLQSEISRLRESKHDRMSMLSLEDKLVSLKTKVGRTSYPETSFYDDEIINISTLKKGELVKQLEILNELALEYARRVLMNRLKNMEIKDELVCLDNFESLLMQNSKDFLEGIHERLHKKEYADDLFIQISNCSCFLGKINEVKSTSDLSKLLKEENIVLTDFQSKLLKSLKENNITYQDLSNKLASIIEGNSIIDTLSDIVNHRNALFKYKNEGNEKCPLRGSENKFSEMTKVEEIGVEAVRYLEKSNREVVQIKKRLSEIEDEGETIIENIKGDLLDSVNQDLNIITERLSKVEGFNNKYSLLVEYVEKMNIELNDEIISKLGEQKTLTTTQLMISQDEVAENKSVQDILLLLNFSEQIDFESIISIKKRIIELELNASLKTELRYFDYNLYKIKLNCITSLISNQEVIEAEKKLEDIRREDEKTQAQIHKISKKHVKVKKVFEEIRRLKKELEKIEFENIGPYLTGIFNKIVKHSNIDGINIKRNDSLTDGGIVLQDNKNLNLMNILSEGQLGVLMISYYFANMYRRKSTESIKVYMMDDVTNSLDDINLLSFIDMLKYMLSNDEMVIDQFFFSTCDDNLEQMFIHKMKSFGVKGLNVNFSSYNDYTITQI